MNSVQRGHRKEARTAPCGPEVDQYRFAPPGTQLDLLAIRTREGDLRYDLPHHLRLRMDRARRPAEIRIQCRHFLCVGGRCEAEHFRRYLRIDFRDWKALSDFGV